MVSFLQSHFKEWPTSCIIFTWEMKNKFTSAWISVAPTYIAAAPLKNQIISLSSRCWAASSQALQFLSHLLHCLQEPADPVMTISVKYRPIPHCFGLADLTWAACFCGRGVFHRGSSHTGIYFPFFSDPKGEGMYWSLTFFINEIKPLTHDL